MNWDEVEDLFSRGLHTNDADRAALLAVVDPDSAATVRALWINADRAGNFLSASLADRGRALLSPGELVGERFKLLEFLGAGGMGEVFSAHDIRLDRRVALKFLAPEVASQPALRDSLEREARALCRLSHPHICILYDFVWNGRSPFLVMEYLHGETLAARLARGPVALPEVLSIACELLDGVAYAHRAGVVHRDLKPANVMVTHAGAKIFDFGIARRLSTEGQTNSTAGRAAAGSASYMSPEQVEGRQIDHRADIFAMGCVIYEMLAGRKAFSGESDLSTIAAILKDTPTPLRDIRLEVPASLQAVVERCLQKEPAKRYQTAGEVAQALIGALSDSSTGGIKAEFMPGRIAKIAWASGRWATLVAAIAVVAIGLLLTIGRRAVMSRDIEPVASIAILPFRNPTSDPDLDYLADGLAESLTNSLARVKSLKVSARTTVLRYKGQDADIRKVGRELGVQSVVTGSISRGRAGRVRVQADLISASGASEMWGGKFERSESELLQIEDELVRNVSQQLHIDSNDTPGRVKIGPTTSNSEAYRWYLRGRFALSRSTVPSTQSAIDFFQKALALDPTFGLAYAGLADSYIGLSSNTLAPVEAMAKGRAAAQRAIELDPALAEAHVNLGVILGWFDFDWAGAEAEFTRVVELRPKAAIGHLWLGWVLFETGRATAGIVEATRAHALDPLDAYIETGLGQMLSWSGQYQLAIQRLTSVIDADPTFFSGHYNLGNAYLYAGRYTDGIRELKIARMIDKDDPRPLAYLAYGYARIGKAYEAAAMFEELKGQRQSHYVGSYFLAIAALANGFESEALQWLERAYDEHDDTVTTLTFDPALQPLRDRPLFLALARQMGLQ